LLTARDFLHLQFTRSWRGYRPAQVDSFLRRVMTEYNALLEENAQLKQQLAGSPNAGSTDVGADNKVQEALQADIAAPQARLQALRQEETELLQLKRTNPGDNASVEVAP